MGKIYFCVAPVTVLLVIAGCLQYMEIMPPGGRSLHSSHDLSS